MPGRPLDRPGAPRTRVLVTGATGTVGREVARALAARPGVAVRVGTRSDAPFPAAFERVPLDYDAPDTLATAFAGVDSFFFVSPLVDRQVEQARRTLAAAVRAGVRHCVRLSSRATGWDDECALRRWHREIEREVVASGLEHTLLRPCSFMQNVLGAPLDLARRAGVLSMPLGSGRIPFVDAADLGEAAACCLLDPAAQTGRTYVLTGARALSGDDLAGALAAHLGRDVRYESTPPEVVRRRAAARGVPWWLTESGLRVYARADEGGEAEVDPALAELLGRAPGSFEAFLARTLEAIR